MITDTAELDILFNAVNLIKHVEGFTCEIGVRQGGSTKLILEVLKMTGQNKVYIYLKSSK